jgi:DNA replication protein DnaC
MEPIQKHLQENPLSKMSPKEALASYEHIELTEDELAEAILWRKQKKDAVLKEQERKLQEDKRRQLLFKSNWPYEQTKGFMLYRSQKLFAGFVIDPDNSPVFELLCYYFSYDPQFVAVATSLGIKNASLDKGIILAGNCGVGKTWLMTLFCNNQRQVYFIRNAKDLANQFEKKGQESIDEYVELFRTPFNDADCFYQTHAGLCIDDMGTDDIKNNYGNKKSVIGDLIEMRYAKKNMGPMFHATTNLTSQQLNDYYGARVISRLREKSNFIELPGKDRRR